MVQHGKSLLQVERARRPSLLYFGHSTQVRNVPHKDHPGQPNAPG
jgi:hypothetical protein